jgi:hypothetical protein
LPYLPVAAQVAFATVPVFPPPDASTTLVPEPSSNANAATSPGVAEPPVGAKTKQARSATTPSVRVSEPMNRADSLYWDSAL